jgi:hypothetical protein
LSCHLLADVEQVEHLFDIGQALADFAIDEADEVERDGELHQHGVDEDEIADGLARRRMHGQRRHGHHDGHADAEDDAPGRSSASRARSRCWVAAFS